MNELEQFEFTKQEEINIEEVVSEISKVVWEFVASGIKGNVERQVTILDIISQMIGNQRSTLLHFAITGITKIDGTVKLQTNEGSIAQTSVDFLENLLQKQVEYFEANLPQAFELRAKVMEFCLGVNDGVEINSPEIDSIDKKMLD